MIGNDIVDLAAAGKECNWQRHGYLKKVFTSREQAYISNYREPGSMVWLLWSMKESAYKIFVQENFRRLLAPLKFQCRLGTGSDLNFSGEVFFEKKSYKTFSRISAYKISTRAYSEISSKFLISNDFEFSERDYLFRNEEMSNNFIYDLSRRINKPAGEFSIKKDTLNIPYLFYRGNRLNSSISFSHHGRYGSYAAELF